MQLAYSARRRPLLSFARRAFNRRRFGACTLLFLWRKRVQFSNRKKPHCKRKRKKDGNAARRASILSQNAGEGTRERERERERESTGDEREREREVRGGEEVGEKEEKKKKKKLEKKRRRRRRRSLKGEGVENQSL